MSGSGAEIAAPAETGAHCDPDEGCITCGDLAVPVRVVSVAGDGLARCADEAGVETLVEIALVEPVAPGDGLLVHAGTALARLDEGTS